MVPNVTDVGLVKKSNTPELKKHAATIHCSNSLSLLQRKISNALLYHAYKELLSKEEHEITIKNLCNLIGYHGNNHAAIKEALKGLLSTVIEWNVAHESNGREDWTASSILASVSLQGPICLYAYSPRMKLLLHSPSMFGKIDLFVQSRFKSSYGLALYENCIRYRGLDYTKWFELDIFRKLMGVPPDIYTIFRDFKKRVIDKSIEEVNMYSDLYVESEVQKEGRQIKKIRFSLKERAKKIRLGSQVQPTSNIVSVLQMHWGFSAEQAEQLCNQYPDNFIEEKIALIESSKNYQAGKVHNLQGYLLSALKNNFQPPKDLKETKSKQTEENNLLEKEAEQMKEAYSAYREQVIDGYLRELSDGIHSDFMERFFSHAQDSIQTILKLQRNRYTPDNVKESPQVKALMRQYALQEIPELQTKLLPLDKFKI
jgi:hypothetical protein